MSGCCVARLIIGAEYTQSDNPIRDYVFGRVSLYCQQLHVPAEPSISQVIERLPTQPSAEAGSHVTPITRPAAGMGMGRRRFVVVRGSTEQQSGFAALYVYQALYDALGGRTNNHRPITTYGGLGVASPNVVKSHHAIIYTRGTPRPTPSEAPRRLPNGTLEAGMRTQAIRVVPYEPTSALDPMSRLNFFDIIEFDAYVGHTKLYGKVYEDSRGALLFQYRAVWEAVRHAAARTRPDLGAGAITLEALARLLDQWRQRAENLQVSRPPDVNDQIRQRMASDPQVRQMYFDRVTDAWRTQLASRAASQQAPSQRQVIKEDQEEEGEDRGGEDEED